MALMAEPREPEVARFIDSYKYDQEMSSRRNRFGGGTSLPLDSDGYEDKQRQLREERHKDWLQQQDKPRDPVYYRVGTPEEGFRGLGEYEKRRQEMNVVRQKEYNDMLRKQRQMEQQKMEARRHQSPPRPAQPPGPQVDYNAQNDHARAEERRAYQDYMGKYQYPNAPSKPPIDYEENKRVLNEERKREYNELMEKKAKEERYWAMRGRPVTPPGGLNIGNYDRQIKETAAQRKKEYKEMLDQQQKEHMYLRARQEPEISVIDRNAQNTNPNYLANKPPPGPGYSRVRDEAFKNESQSRPVPERPAHGQPPYPGEGPQFNDLEGQRPYMEPMERSRSPQNLPPRSPEKPANPNWLRVPLRDDERPEDLGTPLAFKTHSQPGKPLPPSDQQYNGPDYAQEGRRYENGPDGLFERADQAQEKPRSRRSLDVERKYSPSKPEQTMPGMQISPRRTKNTLYKDSEETEERRRQDEIKHQQQQSSKPSEIVRNPFYSSDDYEKFQREIQRKQAEDYRDFLAKSFQPPPGRVGLPLGQYRYEPKRLLLEAERNSEWNQYVRETSTHTKPKDIDGPQGLNIDVSLPKRKQAWLERQRNKDYNEYMKKRTIRQKAPTPPDQQGLPIGQQHYEPMHKAMEQQRNKEYNEFLQKKYGNKGQRTTRSEPDRPVSDLEKASFYYGNEKEHQEKRKMLEEERKKEYNQFVKELEPPPSKDIDIPSDVDSGLPIGQQHHEAWKKFLRTQRNKEYNQLVDLKNTEVRKRDWNYEQNGVLELRGDDAVQSKQRELRAERQRDYNNYMSQQRVSNPSRRHEFVDTASGPYGGLFHGLGEHGNRSEVLNRERQQEYNNMLDQYGKDRPSGRPNWAKETIPNDRDRGRSPMKNPAAADQYQQMLDEKRREEASRRRYEDPEYQSRLSQGRDRGEAGARYGY